MAALNITVVEKQFDIIVTDAEKAKGLMLDVMGIMSNVPVCDKIKIADLGEVMKRATSRGARDVTYDKLLACSTLHICTKDAMVKFNYILGRCFQIEVAVHNRGPNFHINGKNFHVLLEALAYKCPEYKK